MPAEQATGLIVRAIDWSESSRIVTLWTREFGKVRALAKGARRLKSNFEVALDLLNNCDMVLHRKATGGLDLLTEARVRERFPVLRSSMPAYYAGCYVAELLAEGTADHDPHPDLYDAALATFRGLAAGPTSVLVAGFELTLLRELGHGPELHVCVACGGAAGLVFSALAGGVVCEGCAGSERDGRRLSAETLTAMRQLQSPPHTGADLPAVSESTRAELRQVLGAYVTCRWGRRPRLLAYVEGA
jgi:DNA repair protein RecO (recombination protein O)